MLFVAPLSLDPLMSFDILKTLGHGVCYVTLITHSLLEPINIKQYKY